MSEEIEFFNQRALLLKKQVDEDTPSAPVPGTDAFQLFDGKSSVESDDVERKVDKPYFTGHPSRATNIRRVIDGMFELVPPLLPGTDAAPCGLMLEIGGMAKTLATGLTRYNPISRGIPTATAHWFHGQRFTECESVRAAISGVSFKVGDFVKASTKIQGGFIDVTEDDLPTDVNYDAFRDPVIVAAENARMYVNGFEVTGKELTVDFNSDLKTKQYTGKRRNRITDRVGSYKARFVPLPVADFDPFDHLKKGDIITAEFVVVEDDGRLTLCHVRGQVKKVDEPDDEGDFMYEISGPTIAGTGGGNEFFFGFALPLSLTGVAPDGSDGDPYTFTYGTSGILVAPFVTDISSGALPTGVTLDDLVISGTPSAVGTFAYTIRVTDAIGQVATKAESVVIAA